MAVWNKTPGCLTQVTLDHMQRALVQQTGQPWDLDRGSLPPVFSQYWRSVLDSRACREKCRHFRMCWICCSRREQRQHACDVATQRLKSLEQTSTGGDFDFPATGAGTGRDGQHVFDSGNAGGFEAVERRSESEGCWKRMGSKIRKRGSRFLGSKRKAQEGRQPQGKGQRSQGRWPKRRWKERRGGEREEAVNGLDGDETVATADGLEDVVLPGEVVRAVTHPSVS